MHYVTALLAASMPFFIGLTMLTTSLEVGRFQIVFALMSGVDDRDLLAILLLWNPT